MQRNRPIADTLASENPTISVEFFPPKDEKGAKQILATAEKLRERVSPDFVSITYGAGGTTRERTFRQARILKDDCGFEVMPHLTCVGSSRKELIEIVGEYEEAGFCNFMLLRGDPPKDAENFQPHPDGLRYGSDLVQLVRENFSGFSLGVGGYPETHPEAPSPEVDLKNLKTKVDAGASFITTQLFYDNADFFRFVDRCRKIGIQVPIIPGLMPILSLKQSTRFCKMCGANIPGDLRRKLEDAGGDTKRETTVGIEWTLDQIRELRRRDVNAFHFYILNRSRSTLEVVEKLREEGVI